MPPVEFEYEGELGSIDREVDQDNGQTVGTLNVQLNDGDGVTRSFERDYDAETQSVSRSSETVTNGGHSVASADAISCDGAGTCSRSASATGPDGQSIGYDRTVSAGDGAVSNTQSITGPQGESVTQARSVSLTEDGVERGASLMGPEQGVSVEGAFGYSEEDGFERYSSITGLDGRMTMTDGSIECTGGTCQREASQTGPDGEGRSVDNRTTLGEYGFVENERNVTAPNGETRTQIRFGRVGRPRRT